MSRLEMGKGLGLMGMGRKVGRLWGNRAISTKRAVVCDPCGRLGVEYMCSYLAHKRYKALLDGNGTEYNYIIHCEEQQKLGLEGLLSDEEDYTKDDDEEEDYTKNDDEEEEEGEDEEEEGDSDDGGPRMNLEGGGNTKMIEAFLMLSGGTAERLGGDIGSALLPHRNRKQCFSDASKETRVSVVALLSEVSALSHEKIATFAKVPHTLAQLKEKYELLRRAEIALAQQRHQQLERFRQGEVIDVDRVEDDKGGGDSVVVLDSDEEDCSGDGEERVEVEEKGKKAGELTKATPKGWGDYDDGDEDCWGTTEVGTKEASDVTNSKTQDVPDKKMEMDDSKADVQEANKSTSKLEKEKGQPEINDSSLPDKKVNGDNANSFDILCDSNADLVNETGGEDNKSAEEEGGKVEPLTSTTDKNISESDLPTKPVKIGNENVSAQPQSEMESHNKNKDVQDSKTHAKGDTSLTVASHADPGPNSTNSDGEVSDYLKGQETEPTPTAANASLSVDSWHKNVEEESTKPELMVTGDLYNGKDNADASNDSDDVICIESESATASRVHNYLSQSRNSVVVTKSVTFMSNITSEPTYVSAKVGFSSWDSLVHFNFTGDHTHLPTVMSVDSQSAASSKSSSSSSKEEEEEKVYERLFPPVSTLLPGYKSEGAVIKQRLKGLPCLSAAYLKLSRYGTSRSSSSSLLSTLMSNQNTGKGDSQPATPHQSQRNRNQTKKSKFHQSTPHPSHMLARKRKASFGDTLSPITSKRLQSLTPLNRDADEQHSAMLVDNSLDSVNASVQSNASKPSFQPAAVMKYLEVVNKPDPQIKTPDIDPSHSPFVNLPLVVQHLENVYTESGSSLPDSPQVAGLLSQFYTYLTRYLPDTGVSPEKESELLKILVSTGDSSTYFLDKKTVDVVKNLTNFQVKLLTERLRYLTKTEDNNVANDDSHTENAENKRKNVNSDNPSCKRLKPDSPEESNSLSKDVKGINGNGDVDRLGNGDSSCIVNEDPTTTDVNTSKPQNGEIYSDLKPVDSKREENSAYKKDTAQENVKEATVNISSSFEDNENGSHEAIVVHDSTMENNTIKEKSDTTHGKTKPAASKKEQGDQNDSTVDRICIGSSSEDEEEEDDEDDDDDSDSDGSDEVSSTPTLDARTLCRTDDPDGDLFVINNTSEEEELEDDNEEDSKAAKTLRNVHRWKPCVKEDPYPVQERLHLMLEEAFFLSYGLGCLRIIDPESKVLDLKQTWGQFQVLKEQFVPQYVAYHYFRSKGWVPKSGLKFGCDFILYREGPPFYHGSYSVVVQCVQEGSLLPCTRREGYPLDHRHLNWISLAGLNRITEHVAKELMFCYVIWPKGLGREDISSPECVKKFKVKEVLVSRWVSSQERENKTEEDMP
ncbi:tRNA-splicing endonuclease subunit Sen2-like [Elysia marginata]|uniref:tRNA-intron lyase n=1 Tax=Elysia marginata TaxID=1093978 RepID=A0AAV4IK29_9GAST|nr:tRNA-splicing endonuclease subunit Sen2-like [Elysia marginata]